MRVLHDFIVVLFSAVIRYCCTIERFFPFSVSGRANLPNTPFVICANHASHLDFIALVEAMDIPYEQTIAIAAADFHFTRSPRSWIIKRMFNLAPIERSGTKTTPLTRASSMIECARVCRAFLNNGGRAVILYPEGSRSPDGHMRPFQSGVFAILRIIGHPVVPAHVGGTFRVFSKTRLLPRLGRLSVRFGAPLPAVPTSVAQGSAEAVALVAGIEAEVRALAGPETQTRAPAA